MLCKGKGTCYMFIGVKNQQNLTWYIYLYQKLSSYLEQYGSYGLHKISASGDKYIKDKVKVHLNTTYLLVLIYASNK